jgi:hypothetical protein
VKETIRIVWVIAILLAFSACRAAKQPVAEVAERPVAEDAAPGIDVIRIEGQGPLLNPTAGIWQEAPAMQVSLLPQAVALPFHLGPEVTELEVRAVHNGEWIGLRLRWRDEAPNDLLRTADFGDQAAVQFPIDPHGPPPSPMMGHVGAPVNILQWRAPFQRDLDKGGPYIRELYPYALVDVYPDEVLRVIDARAYTGALGVDNPVSHPYESPVLDQMAEGWGSLTVKPLQHANGRGHWEEGEWRVVITRPLVPGGPNDPDLRPGTVSTAAFAVWEGGNDEVGSRKAWSNWVPLYIAK